MSRQPVNAWSLSRAVRAPAVPAFHAGAGVSVLPRSPCQEYIDTGRLTLLHEPDESPLHTLFLVQRPGAEANPAVLRVPETLRRAAETW
ncbi:substrate-binding domain-containing protein [Streptomyces sp. NBC_00631]|uniref:LysR substrate-binding domain-containing protein n=1 Tax=Streptomyces sp. NBC_00631 TaxID=2975793 RepID=UPI0030E15D35